MQRLQALNTSGIPGISLNKRSGLWMAYTKQCGDKKRVFLGYKYETKEDAIMALNEFNNRIIK